ncbi:hypothetical protein ON010_g7471 [Phytophthora cinnamomi]|nr:hypothetical protein ON010_g7471 [Phytophthora cinnamomi]
MAFKPSESAPPRTYLTPALTVFLHTLPQIHLTMIYNYDFDWRVVALMHVYDVTSAYGAFRDDAMRCSAVTLKRGFDVCPTQIPVTSCGWPSLKQVQSALKRIRRDQGTKKSLKAVQDLVRFRCYRSDMKAETAFSFDASLDSENTQPIKLEPFPLSAGGPHTNTLNVFVALRVFEARLYTNPTTNLVQAAITMAEVSWVQFERTSDPNLVRVLEISADAVGASEGDEEEGAFRFTFDRLIQPLV